MPHILVKLNAAACLSAYHIPRRVFERKVLGNRQNFVCIDGNHFCERISRTENSVTGLIVGDGALEHDTAELAAGDEGERRLDLVPTLNLQEAANQSVSQSRIRLKSIELFLIYHERVEKVQTDSLDLHLQLAFLGLRNGHIV